MNRVVNPVLFWAWSLLCCPLIGLWAVASFSSGSDGLGWFLLYGLPVALVVSSAAATRQRIWAYIAGVLLTVGISFVLLFGWAVAAGVFDT